jgi:multidrug efflux pump subunit AcrA (membrane-fusion protein)
MIVVIVFALSLGMTALSSAETYRKSLGKVTRVISGEVVTAKGGTLVVQDSASGKNVAAYASSKDIASLSEGQTVRVLISRDQNIARKIVK